MLLTIALCIIAYLIGSISSAVIICHIAGIPDPRIEGSKNPGATNVLRIGGKKLGILTLLADVIKGIIPVAAALMIDSNPYTVGPVMLAVFLGHLYPIFFKFVGGKGVATAFGAIMTVSWITGVLLLLIWGLVFFLTRFASLASIITAILAPICIFFFQSVEYILPVSLISLLLIWRHRSNIRRLMNGTEPKVLNNEKKKSEII